MGSLSSLYGADLDEIKGSGWDSTTDTLRGIRQDTGSLNSSVVVDRIMIEENSTEDSDDHEYDSLTMLGTAGSTYLNAGSKNIIIRGDLTMRSARITCAKMEVWGNIDIREKVDESYTSLFDVDKITCFGNIYMDNADWQISSTYAQRVKGNVDVRNLNNSPWGAKICVEGNLSCDSATISCALFYVKGDCTLSNVTSIGAGGSGYSPMIYVGGTLTFGQTAVTSNMNGQGFGAGSNATSPNNGGDGYYLGAGGSMACHSVHNPCSKTGGTALGHTRGGDGGDGQSICGTSCQASSTAGGGGAADAFVYYNTGDSAGTTWTINCNGNDGGDGICGGSCACCIADGGDGGSAGVLSVRYGSGQITTVKNTNAGAGGDGTPDGGGGAGSNGSVGSAGSSSEISGVHTTYGTIPDQPVLITEDTSTSSTLSWNIPTDADGDDLDFLVEIDTMYSGIVNYAMVREDSYSNPALFSGTAPYTEGTGTVTFSPSGLVSGTNYRWRVIARKRVTFVANVTNTQDYLTSVTDAEIWKKIMVSSNYGGGTVISGTGIVEGTVLDTDPGPGYLTGRVYLDQNANATDTGVTMTLTGTTSNYGEWYYDSVPSEWRSFTMA